MPASVPWCCPSTIAWRRNTRFRPLWTIVTGGLAWLHEHAPALEVDRERIGIGGESVGGGLAAALPIKARDAGEYAIRHQHLTYPTLDDRTGTPEKPGDPLVGEFIWTRQSNQYGWRSYLGGAPARAPQVPARRY